MWLRRAMSDLLQPSGYDAHALLFVGPDAHRRSPVAFSAPTSLSHQHGMYFLLRPVRRCLVLIHHIRANPGMSQPESTFLRLSSKSKGTIRWRKSLFNTGCSYLIARGTDYSRTPASPSHLSASHCSTSSNWAKQSNTSSTSFLMTTKKLWWKKRAQTRTGKHSRQSF